MKTIVLGLGNPILSDDGIGLQVSAAFPRNCLKSDITIEETCVSGLGLLELLSGYDKAILIDAIQTGDNEAGHVHRLSLDSFYTGRHTNATHGISFANSVKLGRILGMRLPKEIIVFAIEARDVNTFGETCSAEVQEAIPECVSQILLEIGNCVPDNP